MNKVIKYFLLNTITLFLVGIIFSCYLPSPLYGSWSDNIGNKLTMNSDNTYSANIVDYSGKNTLYEGSYSVLMNALTFTKQDGGTVNTEWDIRGNMLYLTWTQKDRTSISLTLYKISD